MGKNETDKKSERRERGRNYGPLSQLKAVRSTPPSGLRQTDQRVEGYSRAPRSSSELTLGMYHGSMRCALRTVAEDNQ